MTNNVEPLMIGNQQRSPEKNMNLLLSKLKGGIVPEPNKYYTFIYKAKTPRIQYDQHPCILCGQVFQWGFTGYNIHWEEVRRYTWGEVISNVFELNEEEFQSMQNYQTARMRSS